MKNTASIIVLMACSIAVFAKDKPTFRIEVLGTDAWRRDFAIRHAGTNGTANTNFDKEDAGGQAVTLLALLVTRLSAS